MQNGNVEMQWNDIKNIKKCMLDNMSDLVGKVYRKAKMPWIMQKMINQMDEQRMWKNVNNEEGTKNKRRMGNEWKRATQQAMKEYLENICDKIMELPRTGCYDLMNTKMKELGWNENRGIQNIGNDDPQGNMKQIRSKYQKFVIIILQSPPINLIGQKIQKLNPKRKKHDEKNLYILQTEAQKAMKQMKNKKASGDYDVPGDKLKMLGKHGFRLIM